MACSFIILLAINQLYLTWLLYLQTDNVQNLKIVICKFTMMRAWKLCSDEFVGLPTQTICMWKLLEENGRLSILGNFRSGTLQSRTGSVQGQNRVFPVKFSTQGKTCFHYREPLFSLQGPLFWLQGFPCEKTSQGEPCFHYRERVCSVL